MTCSFSFVLSSVGRFILFSFVPHLKAQSFFVMPDPGSKLVPDSDPGSGAGFDPASRGLAETVLDSGSGAGMTARNPSNRDIETSPYHQITGTTGAAGSS
jgi:hypothetical protein